MKFFKLMILVLSVATFYGTTVSAATKFEQMESCLNGNITKQESDALLNEIREWLFISSPVLQDKIAECYAELTGFPSEFVMGKGVLSGPEMEAIQDRQAVLLRRKCELKDAILEAKTAILLLQEVLEKAEQSSLERQQEALRETFLECQRWAKEDRREALTNAVCSDIFQEVGLPNFEIKGPTYQEVELAKVQLSIKQSILAEKNASVRIIETEDMLPAEYALKVAKQLADNTEAKGVTKEEDNECEGETQ
jgi:hypothetical protein